MIHFEPPAKDEPNNGRLVYFIQFTVSFLKETVYEQDESSNHRRLIVKSLITPMKEAFIELQPQVEILISRVREISPEMVASHGLSGKQLDFKFAVVKRHYRRFLRSRSARLLRNILNVIDTSLGSIIEAVGVGAALKEFKEAVADATLEE